MDPGLGGQGPARAHTTLEGESIPGDKQIQGFMLKLFKKQNSGLGKERSG